MKKKIWFVSPLVYGLIGIIMLLCVSTLFFSGIQLTVIQLTVALITIAAIVWRIDTIRRDIKNSLDKLVGMLAENDVQALEEFPLPAVAFSENDEIMWCNSLFEDSVVCEKNSVGSRLSSFVDGIDAEQYGEVKRAEVLCKDKKYTMYLSGAVIKNINGYVAYFVDNTHYKNVEREYSLSRPVAMIVLFDNKEEILNIAQENDRTRIKAAVEDLVNKWAGETTGVSEKLDSGKFLVIVEERHLDEIMKKNFSVLNDAREIKADDRNCVTLSIGVGRGAKTIKESVNWANQALDMCLGRGGDQAAVKSADGYAFYGGVSKTIEKRSRVRARIFGKAFLRLIEGCDNLYVMGHKASDIDSVGACIGIYSLVRSLGKEARIVLNRSTTLAGKLVEQYTDFAGKRAFISPEKALEQEVDNALLVIVDTHSPELLDSKEFFEMFGGRVIIIDHHRKSVNYIESTLLSFHESSASSASEMVADVIQCLNENCIGRIEAEALLAGITLDTKNFVIRTGVRTFETAAFLRRKGAETVEVRRIFAEPMDTYRGKMQFVYAAEIIEHCAISIADIECVNTRIAASQAADELLTIQDVDASFVLYGEDSIVYVAARSFGRINVQLIMEELGGGGHSTMAGAQIKGAEPFEVKDRIVKIIERNKSEDSAQKQ